MSRNEKRPPEGGLFSQNANLRALLTNLVLLPRHLESGTAKGFADGAVGVEVNLPVVVVVNVGANAEDRSGKVELEDFDGRVRLMHVRNLAKRFLQKIDGFRVVGAMLKLCDKVHTAERVRGEVLDVVREDLVVANDGANVVHRVDGRDEEPDVLDGADNTTGVDEVPLAEGLEDDEENARGEVREKATPGGTDREAGAGEESGKGGGLDSEESEDRDDEDDAKDDAKRRPEITAERVIGKGLLHDPIEETFRTRDKEATDDPKCNAAEKLETELRPFFDNGGPDAVQSDGLRGRRVGTFGRILSGGKAGAEKSERRYGKPEHSLVKLGHKFLLIQN